MAGPSSPQDTQTFATTNHHNSSNQSDYGSDIDLDETGLTALLEQAETKYTAATPSTHDAGSKRHRVRFARPREFFSRTLVDDPGVQFEVQVYDDSGPLREPAVEVEYCEGNRGSFSPRRPENDSRGKGVKDEGDGKPDTRSPLQRFRKVPKKPLSVTDLVSPAWCELQYWYNLTRYGRVQPTPAMRQGSGVHKSLEEQVHGKEVAVDVVTREDAFALRLWNGIQSLRTLRVTGMTRELEVWGMVEGEVVIGVIDEVCTSCPDEVAEARMLEGREGKGDGKKGKSLGANQTTLTNFLSHSSQNAGVLEDSSAWPGCTHDKPHTFYLVDIKTRQSRSLPKEGSPSRPTHIQLMLYHRLLTSLASNTVPASQIFDRYRLDPKANFSDTLIAQIGNLDFNFPSNASEDEGPAVLETASDAVTELLSHNNLEALWSLYMTDLQKSIPNPATSISPLLTAEFRSAAEGTLIGKRCFSFDGVGLERYVRDEMRWWRGERPAVGVEIEDAYKCGFCKFSEGCDWRLGKMEEQSRKMRLRQEGRRRCEV